MVQIVGGSTLITEDIGEYSFDRLKNYTSADFLTKETVRYEDSDGLRYNVEVIEFDGQQIGDIVYDNAYIDEWIELQSKNGSRKYAKDFVLINANNNEVFWKSGNIYVEVSDGRKKPASPEEMYKSMSQKGEKDFPEEIVLRYLEKYPSDCGEYGCVEIDYTKEIADFQRLISISKIKAMYESYSFECDSNWTKEQIKEELLLHFDNLDYITESDYEGMIANCKKEGLFITPKKEKEPELEYCIKYLEDEISDRVDARIDEDITDECILRREIKNMMLDKADRPYNDEFFEELFKKRDLAFADNLQKKLEKQKEPQRITTLVDGQYIEKIIIRKENCTGTSSEGDEFDDFNCYTEEIVSIRNKTDKLDKVVSTEKEIPIEEKQENLFQGVLNFMKTKLNPLNWFD